MKQEENSNINALNFEIDALKREIKAFKHQQEQDKKLYSEENMREAFNVGRLYLGREGDTNFEQFIKQFKNK